jgi:hypothetical protein
VAISGKWSGNPGLRQNRVFDKIFRIWANRNRSRCIRSARFFVFAAEDFDLVLLKLSFYLITTELGC